MEDHESFNVSNGVWHIAKRAPHTSPEELINLLVFMETIEGSQCLLAFSDEHLAQDFLEKNTDLNGELEPFHDPIIWIDFLKDIVNAGYKYIGFDPHNGRFADFGEIVVLIKDVQDSL